MYIMSKYNSKKVEIDGVTLLAEPKVQPTEPDPDKQPKGITIPTSSSKIPYIPKLQYQITKWRTGSNSFPGTKEFENKEPAK